MIRELCIDRVFAENPMHVVYIQYCKTFEDMLVKNKSGWFVGDSVTIADLKAHHFLNWLSGGILDGIPTTCLDAYPTLKAVIAKVEDLPQVVAFRAKHGKKYGADFDFIP